MDRQTERKIDRQTERERELVYFIYCSYVSEFVRACVRVRE